MHKYQLSLVTRRNVESVRPVRHYLGLPEPVGRSEDQEDLPEAEFLVIEDIKQSGACLLLRFSATGQFSGDTWHESESDAKDQARFEFPGSVGEWRAVDHDEDPVALGVEMLASDRSGS